MLFSPFEHLFPPVLNGNNKNDPKGQAGVRWDHAGNVSCAVSGNGKGLRECDFPCPIPSLCNCFLLFRVSFLVRLYSGLCSNWMPRVQGWSLPCFYWAELFHCPESTGFPCSWVLISDLPAELCARALERWSPSPAQRLCCLHVPTPSLDKWYRPRPYSWAFDTQRRL